MLQLLRLQIMVSQFTDKSCSGYPMITLASMAERSLTFSVIQIFKVCAGFHINISAPSNITFLFAIGTI